MPRLFPGVDPFLEAQGHWPDFHTRAITYIADAIGDFLPDSYLVRIQERIHLIERSSEAIKRMRPDLLIERSGGFSARAEGVAAVLEVEPSTIPVAILEEVREVYIEIVRRPERTLVTVIELLSPDNKAEPGYGQYLAKQQALLGGPAHLVELDFLVGGHRMPMARPLPPGDAYAIVARGDRRPDSEVYAWSIRRALSSIRIPLLPPDPDIRLDLAAIYETTFEKGRYARSIDYGAPIAIALAPEDRAWAEGIATAAAG